MISTLRSSIVLSMFMFLDEILSQDEHRIEEILKFEQNVSDHENQKIVRIRETPITGESRESKNSNRPTKG